jgi:hypothetical protein
MRLGPASSIAPCLRRSGHGEDTRERAPKIKIVLMNPPGPEKARESEDHTGPVRRLNVQANLDFRRVVSPNRLDSE